MLLDELDFGWYCPSEGDGHYLGTHRPERAPTFGYLAQVAQAAERAGASIMLVPTGAVNDSFAPDAPFAESWTTGAALAAVTTRMRLLVAVNPAGTSPALLTHQAETLWEISEGRLAINLVAGGGPDDGYGHLPLDHDARYARLSLLADALRSRLPDLPLFLGGASEAAISLASRVADTYLLWGEPVREVEMQIAALRAGSTRPIRVGLRLHIVARRSRPEAIAAAHLILSRAEVQSTRADEYAAFDSVGQHRMNAIPADDDQWAGPNLWAGIRSVRGGAGTALVGSYAEVAASLDEYREAGVDLVIASGYPHLEEVTRVSRRVWPRISA